MLIYDPRQQTVTRTTGGYSAGGLTIRDTYARVGGMRCVLYEPEEPAEKSRIAVICIHSDGDYSTFPIGGELAKWGYRTLCGQVSDPEGTLDRKLVDVGRGVRFLRSLPGVEKVVLMGHSGGATLMSAYQAAAEKGVGIFQTPEMLIPCTVTEALPPADALMTLDSNWGNGAMTLVSVDPAVVEEGNGVRLDPELDIFSPKNGFDPQGSTYSQEFLDQYFAAQAARNNRIIAQARERLFALEHGQGRYTDDEPLVITGAGQMAFCNRVFPQDIRLANHTRGAYPLLHPDGTETVEIIRSVRRARGGSSPTGSIGACVLTTVRSFLSNRAVLAGDRYGVRPDGIEDVRWDEAWSCTPGNIRHVEAPLLAMGMTGSYEFLAAEAIYQNAGSRDKTIAFVEGAGHNFDCRGREDEFGDTQKRLFDYVDGWLSAPGRLD